MGGLFKAPAIQPAAAPIVPTRQSEEVQISARKQRKRRQNAEGRSSTLLTTGQGVQDDNSSSAKALLGN